MYGLVRSLGVLASLALAACSPSAGDGAGAAGAAGTVAAAGAAGSATDGSSCSGSSSCAADRFCDHPFNDCGKFAGIPVPGTCSPRTQTCDATQEPACGCDGHIYDSPCDAQHAGADLDALHACTTPAGKIPCGWTYCDPATTYCHTIRGDVGPSNYACVALPAACQASTDCSCFGDSNDCALGCSCASDCSVIQGGGTQGFLLACGAGPF